MSFSISNSDTVCPAEEPVSGPWRFIASAALTGLLVLAAFWLLTGWFRRGFLDPEYGMWVAKQEMVRDCRLGSTIILGDSRMVADVIPGSLGNATNLALGGATPIEMYYTLLHATRCSDPPRRVVISFSPAQLMRAEYFWPRTALFDYLSYRELEDVRAISRQVGDDLLYPSPNVGDFDAIVTNWLHAHHFPSYYMSSIIHGHVAGRLGIYQDIHDSVKATGGHHLYGEAYGVHIRAEETELNRFRYSPLLDAYLGKLLTLADRNRMQVDYIAAPWSDATYARVNPVFVEQLAGYLQGLVQTHSDFHLVAAVTHMDDSYFGDPAHLNASGAALFTARVAALLRFADIDRGTVAPQLSP